MVIFREIERIRETDRQTDRERGRKRNGQTDRKGETNNAFIDSIFMARIIKGLYHLFLSLIFQYSRGVG